MEARHLATAVIAMLVTALLIYAAARYPTMSTTSTSTVMGASSAVQPASSSTAGATATSVGTSQASIETLMWTGSAGAQGGLRLAPLEEGLVTSSVAQLLEGLEGAEGPTSVIATVATIIPVASITPASVPKSPGSLGQLTSSTTGTLLAVRGVDELDTVKVVGDLLLVSREQRIYRVNLSSLNPLEPLVIDNNLNVSSLALRVTASINGKVVYRWVLRPRLVPRGLVALGNDTFAAVLGLEYSPFMPPYWSLTSTLVVVYSVNGSLSCVSLLPGYPVDARGYNGTLWVLSVRRSLYILKPLAKIPLGAHGVAEWLAPRKSIYVTVVDTGRCKASSIGLRRPPFRTLLLVEPGGIGYLLATYWSLKAKSLVTLVTRLEYNGSVVKAVNATILSGALPRNWLAATIYKDRLLVVLEDRRGFTLYTLDPRSLEKVAELHVPRPREAVHAIRLINGYLYIVTYRRIDPLFTINVTNPDKPELLGWRKGPGYDQILQELRGNLVLGIGYNNWRTLHARIYRIESNASLTPVDELVLREVHSWELSKPEAYRYLAILDGLAAYPVEKGSHHYVLTLRVSNDGRIANYTLVEGLRGVGYGDKLYVITSDKLLVLDPETLRVVAEASLSPS